MLAIALKILGRAALLVATVAIGDISDRESGHRASVQARETVSDRETPDHVLSSVMLWNGTTRCSATVFSVGDKWASAVSCSHCFRGVIGGNFWVYFCDGSVTTATLVANDPADDLALFKLPASAVLASSPLPEKQPAKVRAYESIGYPAGEGPYYQTIRPSRNPFTDSGRGISRRWAFDVSDGVQGGHSGSGVFADGRLIGVTSDRSMDRGNVGSQLYCCQHYRIVALVKQHAGDLAGCGPLFSDEIPPQVPVIHIKSRRFEVPNCPNGRCPRQSSAQFEAPPPPPGEDDPPAPEGVVPPQRPPGAPQWTPRPNVEVQPKHRTLRDRLGLKAKEKLPKDVKGNCNQAERIIELQDEVKRLEDQLANVQRQPGPPGKDGHDGRDGRDGKDLTPPPVAEKPKPAHKFPHSVFLGLLAFAGVLGVDKLHRFNKAKA